MNRPTTVGAEIEGHREFRFYKGDVIAEDIHVIEYLAYETLVESRNLERAMGDHAIKKLAASDKLISESICIKIAEYENLIGNLKEAFEILYQFDKHPSTSKLSWHGRRSDLVKKLIVWYKT